MEQLTEYELKNRLVEFFKRAHKAKENNSTKGILLKDIANKNTKYKNMSVKISFGQRFATQIPWMTFLTDPFTTSNGVYPYIGADIDNNCIISYIGYSRYNEAPITEEVNNLISEINETTFKKLVYDFNNINKGVINELIIFLNKIIDQFNKVISKLKKSNDFNKNMDLFEILPLDSKMGIITGRNGTGKTRLLEKFSKNILNQLISNRSKYEQMICLSGTVLDRFPKNDSEESYIYLGKRVSNNMFSEISPFRVLFSKILKNNINNNFEDRITITKKLFDKLGFDPFINLEFKGLKESKKNSLEIDLTSNNLIKNIEDLHSYIDLLKDDLTNLSEIKFQKNNKKLELMNLSSGERSYILTVLTLIFLIKDNSLIIYDEPENSLHPQWQIEIIRDISNIVSEISTNSLTIIATHSPLIVSGIKNSNSYVINLEKEYVWIPSNLYGNTSDTILKEHFGIISPRSISVLNKIQTCLKLAVDLEKEPDKFTKAAKPLLDLNLNLDKEDPLYLTLYQIKNLYKEVNK